LTAVCGTGGDIRFCGQEQTLIHINFAPTEKENQTNKKATTTTKKKQKNTHSILQRISKKKRHVITVQHISGHVKVRHWLRLPGFTWIG
jgi:hypothetical protein